jgi:hypothetical protein
MSSMIYSSSVGHRPVADYCEYGKEPSGSKKYENS